MEDSHAPPSVADPGPQIGRPIATQTRVDLHLRMMSGPHRTALVA